MTDIHYKYELLVADSLEHLATQIRVYTNTPSDKSYPQWEPTGSLRSFDYWGAPRFAQMVRARKDD